MIVLPLLLAAVAPQNASPVSPPPVPAPAVDPAAVTFATDIGLLLVAIKPDKTADYEAALQTLQEALSKAADAKLRAMRAGWRVFKAEETDAKGNALYVHALLPTVTAADYRPSMLLDLLLDGAPPDLLAKYRDAFAAAPTRLSLKEFANMAVAPIKK